MDISHIFATRLKKLREGKYNQGEFADTVGISRGAMSYYEHEARVPDIGVLRQICERHNISADYLIGLVADPDKETSDVCAETGLIPIAARRLRLIQRLKEIEIESAVTVVEKFDEDAQEALELTPFTSATSVINLLLATDEGLLLLNLLGAIIGGAKLVTGSEEQPYFEMPAGHKNLQITFPLENITAALWVNVQAEAEKLKAKLDAARPE
ncbi:MAG: helix-turn-helix domain-containing protein [Peptococcaceae bacterium]|jgi:transcriptional regulator with XRE-family HTH domain|nr:helix-turn-helix domain-containing protein [Peptococcaceae bacterium]